jgi:beta-1,4-mannosyl-glycoprotein beta-1,4-N-acetylglucosaminyltransferase
MAIADPGLRLFDEMLWADAEALTRRYQALFDEDRPALVLIFDRAAACNDLKTILLAGDVLRRNRAMRRDDAHHLGAALVRLGRHDEALEVFDHPKLLKAPWPRHLYWRARALADAGRTAEAIEAVDQAITGRPGFTEALRLRERLGGDSDALSPPRREEIPGLERALGQEAAGDLDSAISGLSELSVEHPTDFSIRGALARTVGRKVLESARPRLQTGGPRRIVNLLPFYNEFTMFRMRLHEMAGWVDHFVVIESTRTFTGLDKPLLFREHQAEFAEFADRITLLALDDVPSCVNAAWARDFYQRDMAVRGLHGLCGPDDLVLLTDADEIVDGRAIEGFDGDFATLQMPTFKYFLNYRPVVGHRKHALRKSSVWKARYLQAFGSSYLRFFLACDDLRTHVIPNAGWHFTSMMDAAAVSRKVDSYAHQEQSKAHLRDEAHYSSLLAGIRNGAYEPGWERCALDDSYPSFVRSYPADIEHLVL